MEKTWNCKFGTQQVKSASALSLRPITRAQWALFSPMIARAKTPSIMCAIGSDKSNFMQAKMLRRCSSEIRPTCTIRKSSAQSRGKHSHESSAWCFSRRQRKPVTMYKTRSSRSPSKSKTSRWRQVLQHPPLGVKVANRKTLQAKIQEARSWSAHREVAERKREAPGAADKLYIFLPAILMCDI